MDEDVARRDRAPAVFVEAETVDRHVAGDGGHAARGHFVEGSAAELAAQPFECVVAQDLAGDPVSGAPAASTHDEHELAVGHRAQQSLDERGAEEARRTRDRDAFAGEALPNQKKPAFPIA